MTLFYKKKTKETCIITKTKEKLSRNLKELYQKQRKTLFSQEGSSIFMIESVTMGISNSSYHKVAHGP
jgi:hypothetical protein